MCCARAAAGGRRQREDEHGPGTHGATLYTIGAVLEALRHRALYAAFDRFPSRKGSAVHIDRFARALFEQAGGGLLYVLGGDGLPAYQREGDVEIVRYDARGRARARARRRLRRAARGAAAAPARTSQLVHFRDPWSGMPLRRRQARLHDRLRGQRAAVDRAAVPVPGDAAGRLERIAELERRCLRGGRRRDHAVGARPPRGCGVARARSSPTAPTSRRRAAAARARRRYLLYFGALQPWQGVDTALRAFARLQDLDGLELVICASVHQRRAKPYRKLAERLEVADRVPLALRAARARAGPLARARAALARAAARLLAQRRCRAARR